MNMLEFRPIPKDVEPEGEQQQDLMGFETLWPDNAIENKEKRATALKGNCGNYITDNSWKT